MAAALTSILVLALGAGAVAKKKPRIGSTIEVEVTSGYHPGVTGPYFAEGDASSIKSGCDIHRTVVLHAVKDGVDSILGTDVTDFHTGAMPGVEGNWHIDTTHPVSPFQIYAVVTKKVKRHYICKRAESELLNHP